MVSELNLVLDKRTDDVRRGLSTAKNHVVEQAALTLGRISDDDVDARREPLPPQPA